MSPAPQTHQATHDEAPVSGCPVTHRTAGSSGLESRFARSAAVLYGLVSYVLFLAVFVYAMGFVSNVAVPRSIDRAVEAPLVQGILINIGLLTLFAVQHSVMARPVFKRWWTRFVPTPIERSTYVLYASAALALVCWQWRSRPAVVWDVDSTPARAALITLGWVGWAVVLASTFMINHVELFGLQQVIRAWQAKPQGENAFRTVLFYRLVRHPLMVGFLIAFWATPTMTVGHLLFAVTTTGYILVALQLEERDLVAALGAAYCDYRRRVPMLVPGLPRRR